MWASLGRECSKPLGALWRYYPFDQLLERDESFPEGFFVGNKMLTEQIMPIDGIPNAYISIDGKVWRNGKEKTIFVGRSGYKQCVFSINNKTINRLIHRLLLEAFVCKCPEGKEGLHINGNPLDNRLENLRWGTRKENVQDAILHGTATIGTKNKQAKFNKQDLENVALMKDKGFTRKEIAEHFSVSITTINRIFNGQTYKKEFK